MGEIYCKCNQICVMSEDMVATEKDYLPYENNNTEQSTVDTVRQANPNKFNKIRSNERLLHSFEKLKTTSIISQRKRPNPINLYYKFSTPRSNRIGSSKLRNDHLETINEKVDAECFTENDKSQLRSIIRKKQRKLIKSNSSDLHQTIPLLSNNPETNTKSFRSNTVPYKCHSSKLIKELKHKLKANEMQSLTIPVAFQETKVNSLFLNKDKSLVNLSTSKLKVCDLDFVIYDLEMSLIQHNMGTFKVLSSYWQLTRLFLKCYPLLQNGSIWEEKPVMIIPLGNIDKIIIGRNTIDILNEKHQITALIQIYIQLNKNVQYNKRTNLIKNNNAKETLIELGIKDEASGVAFIKAISFIKTFCFEIK